MQEVFDLRARRVSGILRAGRLGWIRETGTRARMLDSVEASLLPSREEWDDIVDPTDPGLLDAIITWAWGLQDLQDAVSAEYRDAFPSLETFRRTVGSWIDGHPLVDIASEAGLQMDAMLGVHRGVLTYALQVAVEQGVGLLKKLCEASDRGISQAVVDFPDHLKFGVPTQTACILAGEGVRHRRAAVALGAAAELRPISRDDRAGVIREARRVLQQEERWLPTLGRLVLDNTRFDLQEKAVADG
jgi:helicase